MALPARMDERQKRAVLRAKMRAWEHEDRKRAKNRRGTERRRIADLARQQSP